MSQKIYQSSKSVSSKSAHALKGELNDFLHKHRHVYAKSLRRRVYFDKLPECIVRRKSSAKARLQCFDVAIDILQHAHRYDGVRVGKNKLKEFEVVGVSREGKYVYVHVREEMDRSKNKMMYFISCFWSQKQKTTR